MLSSMENAVLSHTNSRVLHLFLNISLESTVQRICSDVLTCSFKYLNDSFPTLFCTQAREITTLYMYLQLEKARSSLYIVHYSAPPPPPPARGRRGLKTGNIWYRCPAEVDPSGHFRSRLFYWALYMLGRVNLHEKFTERNIINYCFVILYMYSAVIPTMIEESLVQAIPPASQT